MADFTDDERARIRRLLGWEARYLHMDSRLESALDAVNQNAVADQTIIREILTKLTAIDTQIDSARVKFGVDQVGSIHLNSQNMLGLLRSEGKRLVANLARILGVEVKANFYGGGGAPHGGVIHNA